MNNFYDNGYQETIQKGLSAVRSFRSGISTGTGSRDEQIKRLKKEIESADTIVIGAGAGLSTAAGLTYSGERFEKYFGDFAARFGIQDMYSGGFYPFPDDETRWAWWARHIYYNRYIDPPKDVYGKLLALVQGKDYFVITTNVDHQFQRAGFDKKCLFYTQGDYGLFQSVNPANQKTYDNEAWVMQAMEAQGFEKDADGVCQIPQNGVSMKIPTALIPKCPDDGSDMTMNLRVDDSFVEDEGWHKASAVYADFIRRHGILMTLVDGRTNLAKSTVEALRANFGSVIRIYKASIPSAIKAAEVSSKGKSIFAYEPSSPASKAYKTGAPAKSEILWGEEAQGSGRSFRRQAETEWSGLCDDEIKEVLSGGKKERLRTADPR